jgi:hypothetical protein
MAHRGLLQQQGEQLACFRSLPVMQTSAAVGVLPVTCCSWAGAGEQRGEEALAHD